MFAQFEHDHVAFNWLAPSSICQILAGGSVMIYPKWRVFEGPVLATLNVNNHTVGNIRSCGRTIPSGAAPVRSS